MPSMETNKAKIAMRVIEVLEFFDEDHPQAMVMDIARRFNRPQSSTSELLSKLVDLGLLYKDPHSRSYTPTARAAMLGSAVQPEIVRSGRLTAVVDRLAGQTGLAVAVFGRVGPKVQIFSWRSGAGTLKGAGSADFASGQLESLTNSAAGWLLLSTVEWPRRDGMIWRLNAEAAEQDKFVVSEMGSRVQKCQDSGTAYGKMGFGSNASVAAMLLPDQPADRPLALGLVCDGAENTDVQALFDALARGIAGDSQAAPDADICRYPISYAA